MNQKIFKFQILLFLFVVVATNIFASKIYTPKMVNPLSESWRWKNFPELEGKGVRHITEAKDGTIWVGVDKGVLEYNGYEWRLHKNKENGLTDAPIEQVLITEKEEIYAISTKQIFKYNGSKWTKILDVPNYDFGFSKIITLADKSIMLSCKIGILHLQKSGKHVFYSSSNLIKELEAHKINFKWKRFPEEVLRGEDLTNISDIIQDNSGKVWLAFSFDLNDKGKLLQFDPAKNTSDYITDYRFFDSNKKLRLGEEQKLIQADDNKIWVINTSFKAPINVFYNDKWESYWLSEKFGGDEYASDIIQTDDGTIWIGSLGKLYAYKNDVWTIYNDPNYKIPRNKLQLHKGSNNKLWISGLLSKAYLLDYSSQRWITYEGLNFQGETAKSEQWFLEVSGAVVSKKGNQWLAYGVEDGLIDAPVRIIVTKKGQIWAAGSHQNVAATAYFDAKTQQWHKQIHPKLSWGIDYRSVFETADGSIWFGGSVDVEREKGQLSGIIQLVNPFAKTLVWRHFRAFEKGYDQTNSYGIAQTPDGKIWTGGTNLLFFDGQKWSKTKQERLRKYVNALAITKDWLIVGSRYYGVFIYDGKKWENFTSDSGLSNNNIISICAIANDNIWVATESDICHFDGSHWQNNVFPNQMNMDLEGGDILHSSDGAIWINHAERIWKRRAFSYNKKQQNFKKNFTTYRYTVDETAPQTRVTFFSKEVSHDGNTLIQWDGSDFFEETPKERLSYSFRLNGGEWSNFSTQRQHTFLSLASGTYQLEVRAKDLASNIDESPAIITFKVHLPVWKQGWFLALVGTFLITIFLFGYNIFTKNRILEKLNINLQEANENLVSKGKQINTQNEEILKQQVVILEQKQSLEINNQSLESQNKEIQQQRDKLEELSKAKMVFFTNISHELRTPLSLILGPINQLQQVSNELPTTERKKLYEIIERNATRLLKLINQLLDIRKIENNSMALYLQNINLADLLFKITELFQNLSVEKAVELRFETTLETTMSMLDTDKIEKIVVNLLANAFKHTPAQGEITVDLQRVETADNLPDNLPPLEHGYFLIKVADTGKGISEEDIVHIFERYYYQESADKKQNSAGIGLSYVKDLVEVCKGDIQVESTVNQGTIFKVWLPIIADDQTVLSSETFDFEYAQKEIEATLIGLDNPKTSTKSTPKDKPSILVVEDNLDMVLFIEGLLQKNYQVITAENGKLALDIAQNHPLDLIISDVMMPEMDGLEFCKHIKSNFATSHLPVILLTAKSLETHQLEGYEVGADDYIMKPFNARILELKIKNILKQRSNFQTKISREFQITPKEVKLTSPDEEMLENLVKLMEANIDNSDFNVNTMCESVNLSHMHFIRKIKQLTGKRPNDLLKSFRMKRAKDLLSQEKMTISEVAYSVGFDVPGSFSRAFKKEFGKSPTTFLEENENKN